MKKVNIFVNDVLYKTANCREDGSYDHRAIVEGLHSDRAAGLLKDFDLSEHFSVKIEPQS
jgi:hypothetical protein|tara:strand:+ start:1200 stop:1379 length:180 start_codon:yes stop_codon:yes gene_type:complete